MIQLTTWLPISNGKFHKFWVYMTDNQQILVHHFLETSAGLWPDKIALIHENMRISYSQINTMANQLAVWLLDRNVSKGNRVAFLLENSLDYVVTYFAVLKAGACAVPLNTGLKPDALNPLLKNLAPDILISSKKFERVLKASDLDGSSIKGCILKNSKLSWSSDASFPVVSWDDIVENKACDNPDISISIQDLAAIIYTSGSTNLPKGVMLSHKNIVANTHSICHYLKLTSSDRQMVVLPFFYVMGQSLLNTLFSAGGSLVINNKFAYPAMVVNQMVEEKVTLFSGVPSTYTWLLHRSPLASNKENLCHLRLVTQAGGHMSRVIKKGLRSILPAQTDICIMYGATEASARLAYLAPEFFADKIDSIGRAIPGVTMTIRDEKGNELPTGQVGEIVCNGDNIMQGYFQDNEGTKKVLNKNGYLTGDLGYKDSDGFFYIRERKDNLLKVGGHRINPLEIEETIMETGLVIETSVIGLPDEMLGNRLVALVVPKEEGMDTREILKRSSTSLPAYKLPGQIFAVKTLPKNNNGKINKNTVESICNKLIES